MAIALPAYDGLPSRFDQVWRTAQLYGAFGAYPTAIVFGLPAYFILRRHFSANFLGCVIGGFLIAALPWVLLALFGSGAEHASINNRATVINGQTTAYGWLRYAESIGTVGVFGALGGLVFWAVAAAGHKPEAVGADQ